jgi:hypothetical protein
MRRGRKRQGNPEHGALAIRRCNLDCATHCRNKARHDGKTKADASVTAGVCSADLREGVEQSGARMVGHSRSRVAHNQSQPACLRCAGLD